MKTKQTIEVLKEILKSIMETKTRGECDKAISKRIRYIQAIDHAINCVGAIEQIKWERDIAIQQLNELGYEFGEKINHNYRELWDRLNGFMLDHSLAIAPDSEIYNGEELARKQAQYDLLQELLKMTSEMLAEDKE